MEKAIAENINKTFRNHIYTTWHSVKTRCYNRRSTKYKYYGGRGIRMCREWLNSFETFYEWAIANGYRTGLSLDRIDVNGNYEPSNCRWADSYTQSRNKRNNRYLTINGETKILADWAREYNINQATVLCRLRQGWDVERALSTPIQKKYAHNKYTQRKEGQEMYDGNLLVSHCDNSIRGGNLIVPIFQEETEPSKKMLTVSELVQKGWNREMLMRVAHMKDTPFFRTSPKGRFYVMESKLIEFVGGRRVGR